ncbi:hypothetical protein NC652_019167 [Populus alba x Populus x berolinensis]|nr:hypothetical protein NC652_019167 [Populus alba x Populus x berolinensis]
MDVGVRDSGFRSGGCFSENPKRFNACILLRKHIRDLFYSTISIETWHEWDCYASEGIREWPIMIQINELL